jgi:hypothetical protein
MRFAEVLKLEANRKTLRNSFRATGPTRIHSDFAHRQNQSIKLSTSTPKGEPVATLIDIFSDYEY